MIHDALVLGGGPAGAAIATHLARAGRSVVLLEKEAQATDKVCGEFLSSDAAFHLGTLGLTPARLGAVPIDRIKLVRGRREVSARLPFSAWGLSRRVLDEALLEAARAAGATIHRGAEVRAVERSDGAWMARFHEESARGRAAFLATGKHDVRTFKRPAGVDNERVAFKLHFSLTPRQRAELGSTVELHLFEGGYAGLLSVGEARANLCLLIDKSRLHELGSEFERVLASLRGSSPLLDARLNGATPLQARPLALSSIPYGLVQSASRGPFLVGDQAAVIPSFAGDGVAMALHSAALAARALLTERSVTEFQGALSRDLSQSVRLATRISRAMAWGPAQATLTSVAARAPFLLRMIARRTRVPLRT